MNRNHPFLQNLIQRLGSVLEFGNASVAAIDAGHSQISGHAQYFKLGLFVHFQFLNVVCVATPTLGESWLAVTVTAMAVMASRLGGLS